MLLNQCLAISLFPLKKDEQQEYEVNSATESVGETLKASLLFKRLIKENVGSLGFRDYKEEKKKYDENKCRDLLEALRRVEFAGFVVPSWLLISGSFNDLYCLKANWSRGIFNPPAGFKIETIAKRGAREGDEMDKEVFSHAIESGLTSACLNEVTSHQAVVVEVVNV